MRRSLRPVAVAALMLAAITVPAVAWWIVGSAEAERRAVRLETEATQRSAEVVRNLASRLSERLGRLIDTESARPFYHYRNLYHDPQGASQGASVVPSPLAGGPPDPLVQVHFQVDPQGRLGLPTLNEDLPELNRREGLEQERRVRDALAAAAPDLVAAIRRAPTDQASETLASGAWDQIWSANWLYASLRNPGGAELVVPPAPPERHEAPVVVCVGPLQWRTVPVGGEPALVALRDVETPEGVVAQGLRLDVEAATAWLSGGGDRIRFVPQRAQGPAAADVALGAAEWHVEALGEGSPAAARASASAVRSEFLHAYALGTGFAVAAGLGVVILAFQADRLTRERAGFAAAAAHELRTPLASLRLYGEMLAKGLGDPARATDYAARIASESDRLGRVVSNVLAFSLGEQTDSPSRAVAGNLGDAVRDCVQRVAPVLEACGAQLELTVAHDLPRARFDAEALDHVVRNLIDNAERYSRGASDRVVRVSVRHEPGRQHLVVGVDDAGPGVPDRQRQRIFEPFARGTDTEATAGLGLGLALARQLARSMGGDVQCLDGARGGALFELTLNPAA